MATAASSSLGSDGRKNHASRPTAAEDDAPLSSLYVFALLLPLLFFSPWGRRLCLNVEALVLSGGGRSSLPRPSQIVEGKEGHEGKKVHGRGRGAEGRCTVVGPRRRGRKKGGREKRGNSEGGENSPPEAPFGTRRATRVGDRKKKKEKRRRKERAIFFDLLYVEPFSSLIFFLLLLSHLSCLPPSIGGIHCSVGDPEAIEKIERPHTHPRGSASGQNKSRKRKRGSFRIRLSILKESPLNFTQRFPTLLFFAPFPDRRKVGTTPQGLQIWPPIPRKGKGRKRGGKNRIGLREYSTTSQTNNSSPRRGGKVGERGLVRPSLVVVSDIHLRVVSGARCNTLYGEKDTGKGKKVSLGRRRCGNKTTRDKEGGGGKIPFAC